MALNTNVSITYSAVIVGGGVGGVSVAARLKHISKNLDIVVVDPSEFHYYQPAWTLVGGGQFDVDKTRQSMRDCMPASVELVPGRVTAFEPEHSAVVLERGARIGYKLPRPKIEIRSAGQVVLVGTHVPVHQRAVIAGEMRRCVARLA